jgi:hypothetical protein
MARSRKSPLLELEVLIERKLASLPGYVVVPAVALAPWKLAGTTTVEGTLDGVPLGRRSLKRWDEARWFLELKREHLAATGKSPGARATLVIHVASSALPSELQALLERDAAARKRWQALTEARQRMLREEILAAKSSEARARRAERALGPAERPRAPRATGLGAEPRAFLVRILGRDLPGKVCGHYTEVRVGFVARAGRAPEETLAADAREVRFETRIEVRAQQGTVRFKGPAVNGPAGERFLYLTWIGRLGLAAPAMFRRAKLRLDAIPEAVLVESARSGLLIGRLALTAPDGMPVCASIRPPEIAWTSA